MVSKTYEVNEYFWVVQPYQGSHIFGIFWTLDSAKKACAQYEANKGFYVKFDETGNITWVNHFDGTVIYSIAGYERDVMKPLFEEETQNA